jgi:hypothetical protein
MSDQRHERSRLFIADSTWNHARLLFPGWVSVCSSGQSSKCEHRLLAIDITEIALYCKLATNLIAEIIPGYMLEGSILGNMACSSQVVAEADIVG